MKGKYIAYYRVSTQKQGESGLGLEGQKVTVHNHVQSLKGELIREVSETESGKKADRPQLREALRLCKLHQATLVIAKLDRLSRNVGFIHQLMESKVDFIAVDLPVANKFTIYVFAALAEYEAELISQRTKEALARSTKKLGGRRMSARRWKQIGRDNAPIARQVNMNRAAALRAEIYPEIRKLQKSGASSLRLIAEGLNANRIPAPKGGEWSAVQVKRVLDREAA
jgi:DNA invertase Pin-like site-specific DNA recombinase